MIIVEERLTEAFDQLPMIGGFKPVYDWGNSFNLLATLKRYSDAKATPYPLIWQITNDSYQNSLSDEAETDIVLYLACQNTKTELVNKERWAMSYRNILYPLAKNIEKAFHAFQIFTWEGKYNMEEQPNFGKDTANFTADIWDVLIIKTKININANCINTINFNL